MRAKHGLKPAVCWPAKWQATRLPEVLSAQVMSRGRGRPAGGTGLTRGDILNAGLALLADCTAEPELWLGI